MEQKNRATGISIRASREYIQAVNAFATTEGMHTADLVRKALDAFCGKSLKPYVSFFESAGEKSSQTAKKDKARP